MVEDEDEKEDEEEDVAALENSELVRIETGREDQDHHSPKSNPNLPPSPGHLCAPELSLTFPPSQVCQPHPFGPWTTRITRLSVEAH